MIVARKDDGTYWRWDGYTSRWHGIEERNVPSWAHITTSLEMYQAYRGWRKLTTPPEDTDRDEDEMR